MVVALAQPGRDLLNRGHVTGITAGRCDPQACRLGCRPDALAHLGCLFQPVSRKRRIGRPVRHPLEQCRVRLGVLRPSVMRL